MRSEEEDPMLAFPLLSDAYAAALVVAGSEKPEPEEDESNVPGSPGPFPTRPLLQDGDDDLETAPTRPLRLDRLHL
jgi:hypothetical protein